jgi:hypothetical protein
MLKDDKFVTSRVREATAVTPNGKLGLVCRGRIELNGHGVRLPRVADTSIGQEPTPSDVQDVEHLCRRCEVRLESLLRRPAHDLLDQVHRDHHTPACLLVEKDRDPAGVDNHERVPAVAVGR